MLPIATAIKRLWALGGGDVYLVPQEDHVVGAVSTSHYAIYTLIDSALDGGHIIPGEELAKRSKEWAGAGPGEIKRQQHLNGFSIAGKSGKSIYLPTKSLPKWEEFVAPESTPNSAMWVKHLPLFSLLAFGVDKLRGAFPISVTPQALVGFNEFISVSVEHGGQLSQLAGSAFSHLALSRLPKSGAMGATVRAGELWIVGGKGEFRAIELEQMSVPVLFPAALPYASVQATIPTKEIKTWVRRVKVGKGYNPVKLFSVGGLLKLLSPGAGLLELGAVDGLVQPRYFDARQLSRVIKAWASDGMTLHASLSEKDPLSFSDGCAMVSLEPIMEYKK